MAKGEHIYVYCGFYSHHGIDCGDGTVIHYTGEKLKGSVGRTSLAEFRSGKYVHVKHSTPKFPTEEIVQHAESRIGEQEYDLLFCNCEHFAEWCRTGEAVASPLANGWDAAKKARKDIKRRKSSY